MIPIWLPYASLKQLNSLTWSTDTFCWVEFNKAFKHLYISHSNNRCTYWEMKEILLHYRVRDSGKIPFPAIEKFKSQTFKMHVAQLLVKLFFYPVVCSLIIAPKKSIFFTTLFYTESSKIKFQTRCIFFAGFISAFFTFKHTYMLLLRFSL